ncbi:Protein CBR-HSP-12.2 [Caenorhabditis briggsae]|uniref:Protein CBR-HSP-12.2 n=1 Tax=Caenorhabditis briggsae TaxID=6238 RepID=A8XPB0_CAEBR|nr:Protein CBR-HSP-12.2 [Caenorhabditis briggsae]CAP34590.2 Protein CBR-HSP-12.2 [Caenorhabditis briggsae]
MSAIEVTADAASTWDWPLQHNDGVVKVHNTKEKFEVGLDVQFFTPKEIEVKVSGQELLIHCRHESTITFSSFQTRSDNHGTVAREINRAYKLPDDVDVSTVKSHLATRGVLTITAAKKA